MKQLDIGVMVYVGWTPSGQDLAGIACSVGTITGAPRRADTFFYRFNIRDPTRLYWLIDDAYWAAEHLLTPIDDDPEALTTELETLTTELETLTTELETANLLED